jgi:hypothetical protein|tara:strand:- start:9305 stop:11785 length:2481 start_codon:yes stop_codon:yes gene_type:complete
MANIEKPLRTPDIEDDKEFEINVLEFEFPEEGENEIIELEDGGVEVIFEDEGADDELANAPFEANLAEYMPEDKLNLLAADISELVEADIVARREWVEAYISGLEVLGFKYDERTEPWDGACGVYSNVLAEAAIRFQAETMSETFPAMGPVKTKVLGDETKEKEEAANRVKSDMNYELTENMVEYRPEHERLLFSLGLAGSAFKKIYFDPNIGRQTAVYVAAEDVIVPYGESQIENAERATHVMRKTKNELKKLQASGFYKDVDLGEPEKYRTDVEEQKAKDSGFVLTEDNRYALYEVHADLVIEDDPDDENAIARPYVVTIERGNNEVLAIRRNWREDDEKQLKRQHFVHYVYIPGFGFYGLGLIHIIGGYSRAGTSLIRQLVDAGTLSNLPGGVKTRGLRIKSDDTPIEPGEWRDVDVPGGTIKENMMPLPYGEPSATLHALLTEITTEGRRLGAISDMNISDMSANAPVGTTLALLERTLKPMAAVQARVHYTMKQEFKLLKKIISEYAPQEYGYVPERGEVSARVSDYAMVDVIPVSDPNSSTMAQRVVQYQAVHQLSQSAPQIYDLPQLHRQMIEVLGVKNADKLVPISEDTLPVDPVSENMNALVGKPIKAFIYQDSDAHIATHSVFMQDPMVAQTIGQNPQAQQIMAALQAHIAEHLGFRYRKEMEEKIGVPLPAPNKPLPEEIEVNLARMMADAGKQVTQKHMQQAAQQEAQQKAQDPAFQLEQARIQLDQAEQQRKQMKDASDAEIKVAEQKRKEAKDKVDSLVAAEKLRLEEIEVLGNQESDVRKDVAAKVNADNTLEVEIAKLMQSKENNLSKEG